MASHQSYGSQRLVTTMANTGVRIGRYSTPIDAPGGLEARLEAQICAYD